MSSRGGEGDQRWSRSAVFMLAFGMLFGAPSLGYPFGSDQALFWYVGRGWLLHGAIPYRDAFDVKPPLIFLIHGVASLIAGGGMWGIRLFEWLAMIPLGFAVASIATPKSERTPKLRLGLGVLAVNVAYFGFFDFWDTAQCELWCSLATLGGLFVVLRTKLSTTCVGALAGLLAGLAVLAKPPAVFLALVVFATFVITHRKASKRSLATGIVAFVASGIVPIAVTLIYFAHAGALADLVDILVGYNRAYVRDEQTKFIGVLPQIREDIDNHGPWWIFIHGVILFGLVRGRSRARWALAAALLFAATLGIVAQRKFYHYHYGLVVPAHALAVVLAVDEGWSRLQANDDIREDLRAIIAIATILIVFGTSIRGFRAWTLTTRAMTAYLFGDRERMVRRFAIKSEDMDWSWESRERAAVWVREHSSPNDAVLVRGFDPAIYAIAGRRYGGRWYCTHHITSPNVLYKRAEWNAQDRADIDRIKPRIVVARVPPDFGPDINDERWFLAMGYRSVERMPPFVLMERQ